MRAVLVAVAVLLLVFSGSNSLPSTTVLPPNGDDAEFIAAVTARMRALHPSAEAKESLIAKKVGYSTRQFQRRVQEAGYPDWPALQDVTTSNR